MNNMSPEIVTMRFGNGVIVDVCKPFAMQAQAMLRDAKEAGLLREMTEIVFENALDDAEDHPGVNGQAIVE